MANWKIINKLIIPNEKNNNTRVFVSNCIYRNIASFSFDKKDENDIVEKIQILIVIARRYLMNFSLYNSKKNLTIKGLVSLKQK